MRPVSDDEAAYCYGVAQKAGALALEETDEELKAEAIGNLLYWGFEFEERGNEALEFQLPAELTDAQRDEFVRQELKKCRKLRAEDSGLVCLSLSADEIESEVKASDMDALAADQNRRDGFSLMDDLSVAEICSPAITQLMVFKNFNEDSSIKGSQLLTDSLKWDDILKNNDEPVPFSLPVGRPLSDGEKLLTQMAPNSCRRYVNTLASVYAACRVEYGIRFGSTPTDGEN